LRTGPPPVHMWLRRGPLTVAQQQRIHAYEVGARARAEERLRTARAVFGHIRLQVYPYITTSAVRGQQAFSGQGIRAKLPEAVDAFAFMADLKRFAKSWRPERMRTERSIQTVKEAWERWERAGSDLKE